MKNIEITTSQKVAIRYPLASVLQRIIAFIIDAVILLSFYKLVILFIILIVPYDWAVQEFVYYLILLPFISFYTLFFETILHGQTPGKKALGIRVVKLSGDRPEFYDYLTRWLFRIIDIWFSTGSVAVISCISAVKGQRLGDIIANTAVVQMSASKYYALSDVMNIMKLKDYTVSYPDVKHFSEDQMLLIKETLERNRKHPNDAHKKVLKQIAIQVSNSLELAQRPRSAEKFLKVVLRDYVFLTR